MTQAKSALLCPHCGAKVSADWKTCWLCGLELPANLSPAAGETAAAGATPQAEPLGALAITTRVIGGLLLGVVALTFAGLVLNGDFGGAIGWLVLLIPAGIVTLTKSLRSKSEGVELTALDRIGTFMATFAMTVGVVLSLAIAAFVALCVACFAIMSTGNMNFH